VAAQSGRRCGVRVRAASDARDDSVCVRRKHAQCAPCHDIDVAYAAMRRRRAMIASRASCCRHATACAMRTMRVYARRRYMLSDVRRHAVEIDRATAYATPPMLTLLREPRRCRAATPRRSQHSPACLRRLPVVDAHASQQHSSVIDQTRRVAATR